MTTNQVYKEQVAYWRAKGKSARVARRLAGLCVIDMVTNERARNKIVTAAEKNPLTKAKPCDTSKVHVKVRTRAASNAAVVDTFGKRRDQVIYHGQKSEDFPLIITRKRDKQEAHIRKVKCQQSAKEARKQRGKEAK